MNGSTNKMAQISFSPTEDEVLTSYNLKNNMLDAMMYDCPHSRPGKDM